MTMGSIVSEELRIRTYQGFSLSIKSRMTIYTKVNTLKCSYKGRSRILKKFFAPPFLM